MGNFFSVMMRNIFGLTLLINMLWCAALCKLWTLCSFLSPQRRQGLSVLCVHFAWRISLFFSPWIRLTANDGYSAVTTELVTELKQIREDKAKGKEIKPIFILGNHTSFLDTILTASMLPSTAMYRARTYMGAHLFKLPLLSTVCRACGHFPVNFTSSKDGVFSVDREKMAETQKLVDQHTDDGGILCFFPEGQMNGDPDTLLPLRYGGLKKALEKDARIYSFVTRGNPQVWPRKAQVGGFPGKVGYSLKRVAGDGCKALVSTLSEKAAFKGKKDYEVLAEYCRDVMQAEYDSMAENKKTN